MNSLKYKSYNVGVYIRICVCVWESEWEREREKRGQNKRKDPKLIMLKNCQLFTLGNKLNYCH